MKKKMFVKQIVKYLGVLVLLFTLVLVVFTFLSFSILRSEAEKNADNFLRVYGGELKSRVRQMDNTLQSLLLQNTSDLQLLKSSNESNRTYASLRIRSYISSAVQNGIYSEETVDYIVVAEKRSDICLDAGTSTLSYWDREHLRAYVMQSIDGEQTSARWDFVELNGKTYLHKMFIYNGRLAGFFTQTQAFIFSVETPSLADQTFVLANKNGTVIDFIGEGLLAEDKEKPLQEAVAPRSIWLSYLLADDGRVVLHSLVANPSVWQYARVSMLLVFAVLLFSIVFGFFVIRYVRREMAIPMRNITHSMECIDQGEYTHRIENEFGTKEFSHLKNTFNSLMDEVVNLRISSYEKIIELKDMELRGIRLQIRPHFFLNAITTLSSLSTQGDGRQIKTYADALAKNIRYMFKSGLHTVQLKEELQYVENYFEMQECKYPGCVFYYIEAAPEVMRWGVPQMLVQTFIENEFKYAVSVDSTLMILIKACLGERDGQRVLLLEIEDDGKGYPQKVLDYMSGRAEYQGHSGERVGLWGVKRTMELMYERRGLVELTNIRPHGCLNRIWVPETPVHEFIQKGDNGVGGAKK